MMSDKRFREQNTAPQAKAFGNFEFHHSGFSSQFATSLSTSSMACDSAPENPARWSSEATS